MQTRSPRNTPSNKQNGFTLVELISTVVLIGILSVAIVPRFGGSGTYAEYTLRDQLISSIRFVQQGAMYDHQLQSCYRLHVEADEFGPQRSFDNGATFEYFGPGRLNAGANSQYKITAPATLSSASIYFDGLGNAIPAGATPCVGAPANTEIAISAEVELRLCVLSTGFVEKFACP